MNPSFGLEEIPKFFEAFLADRVQVIRVDDLCVILHVLGLEELVGVEVLLL